MVDEARKSRSFHAQPMGQAKRGNRPAGMKLAGGTAHQLRDKSGPASGKCDACGVGTPKQPNALESGKPFDTFFHQLAHNLRTPLNHINGFAEILLMNSNLDEAQADYVRCILQASTELQAAVLSHLNEVAPA